MPKADFTYTNHGSIGILHAWTDDAKAWTDEHINGDDIQTWGRNGIVVEPRYIGPILEGIQDAGLTVGGCDA